ncbi:MULTISPECIES: ubiquinol-cytochrome C chaperone family protein [Rhodopseudomonas]|uniref:Ubiquinol-cytochrome C chaperone n=1 Tax=Rhodopseudomonas palustris TaxID=1076 RepID=A0A0D7F8B6_RHOPL|nr:MULTISPECIES: ubiquinol-cytochrome C chaperone family protein [Rhodopseudomonas]KIZ47962.1 ubiquinol-cytochrome C chaperone [Rhodopseudomonas palustris]MDF3808790.1 ubiquinol-cytochrome C chaperone family protein [Rhodopseudomonas sp. BAL398]WOK19174.1 ubiquinol-cytochrome C chaperone family protein [Rhodopseudomonas sp. BAL398]
MFWPFNRFSQPRTPSRGTIEVIYGMIVAQAREPTFYQDLGVADTVNGRFEMIVLHLWMVLRRIRAIPDNKPFAQALFDYFCSDLDANLRELGVGDLTVPKRMQAFGEAFYGRSTAYDMAIEAGEDDLARALNKNVLNGAGPDEAKRLATYVIRSLAALDGIDRAHLRTGSFRFQQPVVV